MASMASMASREIPHTWRFLAGKMLVSVGNSSAKHDGILMTQPVYVIISVYGCLSGIIRKMMANYGEH